MSEDPGDNSHLVERLDHLTNGLLVLILLIPFVISAGALSGMAESHGIPIPWLYPFMVDGGLLIFKAQALRASLKGRRDWYTWGMAAALTLVSVMLNVLHVPDQVADRALGMLMAALPPVVILTTFIAVSRRVEESVKEAGVVKSYETMLAEMSVKQTAWREQEQAQQATLAARQAEVTNLVANRERLTRELDSLGQQKAVLQEEVRVLRREKQAAKPADKLPRNGRVHTTKAVMTNGRTVDKGKVGGNELSAPHANGNGFANGRDSVTTLPDNPLAKPAAHDPSFVNGRDNVATLTDRQQQVAALWQEGLDKAQIAARLGISERTVYREMQVLNGEGEK